MERLYSVDLQGSKTFLIVHVEYTEGLYMITYSIVEICNSLASLYIDCFASQLLTTEILYNIVLESLFCTKL